MLRKTLCRLLCVIAIICLTATSVFAAGYFNGSDRLGSISFHFNNGEISVTGGSVELRMLAFWNDEIKSLQWCEDYADAGLTIDDLFGENAASKLFEYAQSKQLPAQEIQIGEDGTAKVEDLQLGVWLLSQTEPFEGYETMLPALISIPMEINKEWIFDVEAVPKLEPLVEESTVPTTETPPPDLPPTGQVNWPVPLLLLGGVFLILVGLCIRRERRHEN